MPLLPPSRARRGSTVLIGTLLVTLVVTATLAFEAWTAARSHRATAEQALRDYAAVAAWDFSLYAKERMYAVLNTSLGPVDRFDVDHPGESLPPPRILERSTRRAARCETPEEDARRYLFRLDLRDGSLATSGADVSPAVASWITRAVAADIRETPGADWTYSHLYGEADGRRRVLAYAVKRAPSGEPVAAYGYESCLTAWGRPIFQHVMRRAPLLPPALTGELPNDSLFSVTVTDPHGRVLFQSATTYPETFAASFQMDGAYGGAATHVRLSPMAAERLVIGGLPPSRLPFLLGLLALTTALIGVAIVQLRREQDLARLRADFVSSVSHELRTPLAQIRMFAETLLLDRVRGEGERRRALQIIDQEARRLTHLVGNVLQFSGAERQTALLKPQPSELAPEVREAMEVFAPLATSRRTTLVPRLEEGIAAKIDRFALRQVLLNLLDNAVKYGPAGQTVTVELGQRGPCARIAISDEGPGISERERDRIWEPFYRRERDANSAVAGSGIGLAVVRELVRLHGGRCWMERAPGGGSRFVVELPRIVAPGPPRPPAGEEPARGGEPAAGARATTTV